MTFKVIQGEEMTSVPYRDYFLWHKGDFDSMTCYLESVEWTALIHNNPSAESMWSAFMQILWFAINLFVPSYTNNTRGNARTVCKRPKLHKLCKLAVKKHKLWNKLWLHRQDTTLCHRYRECVHQWKEVLRADVIAYEQSIRGWQYFH